MNSVVDLMLGFLREIGISYSFEKIDENTFLPGLKLRDGTLVIDIRRLRYPGDILHEAGHLACMPEEMRRTMNDNLDSSQVHQGGEMMAIAWSYAVCIHLDIDPKIVFHEHGYKGSGESILANFSQGQYFGVPLLEWCGMSYGQVTAKKLNKQPFPAMISWVCEKNMYNT
ncbi:hypothetical protein [Mucilaginibacter sp. L3T2-6]|uniref:hypothetical protein n=1 Tax=Mucilaginibacter sp. L3T2-6 TaxID=3062491 RepID=UPI0026775D36|nr:hypothetical protein [Mucilaginibacter sp. L3T2-6]MDO3642263.1 hypothetical protein [Mucilaginibacter sp. L3T2-6]MDV6214758.1 hypothetical protein [Mucilaginibacter sp. L3T2-6]